MHCPKKASYFCNDGCGWSVARVSTVEGVTVTDILLDTGCSRTMARAELVRHDIIIQGETIPLKCPWDNVPYPIAEVRVQLEGVEVTVKAVVSQELLVAVLLERDVPELGQLFYSNLTTVHTLGIESALVTRAQAQR